MTANSGRQVEVSREFESLCALLDNIDDTADQQDQVSVRDMQQIVGRRWYGPLLSLAGIVMLTPVIGDIPGVPVIMGAVVILISWQMLMRNQQVWLPLWLQKRHVASDKVKKAIRWMKPPARFVDRFTQKRLVGVLRSAGLTIIALMSIMVAALTPLLELIPFSATLAGAAIFSFGISVLARDGVIAIIAICFSIATLVAGGWLIF